MEFDSMMIQRLRKAQHVIAFTGAGVSQESGIPTFRDAMTGLWENFNPEDLATLDAFSDHPEQVWGWYEWRRKSAMNAKPNPAHIAIAAMARHVPKMTVITQNVDNLHERAGSQGVIHLHGSLHHPRCRACDRPYELPIVIPEIVGAGPPLMPPKCKHCGGWIRPGVVWFGEPLPSDSWSQTRSAVRSCDLMFSIGTSSVVFPAAVMPFEAAERGACVIQVNLNPTDLDPVANYNLRGKAGEIMAALYESAWVSDET